MQWAQAAIWSGLFISLIKTQIVPGSFLGFPNCTDPCDYIITAIDSPCSIYTLTHDAAIICFCQNTTLFDEVVDCAASHCTPSDLESAFEIAAGGCQDLGVAVATPSVSGFTLSFAVSIVSSATTTSLSSATTAKISLTTATSAVSTTTTQSSKVATTTSSHNVTATSSSNMTVYTGGASMIIANNLLAGLGLGLYCVLL